MNAEILHDALNLLPGDLITATDKLRSAPRKAKIHWLHYTSMAACIALILYGGMLFASGLFGMGGSTEAAPEEMEMAQIAGDQAESAERVPESPAAADSKNNGAAVSEETSAYSSDEPAHVYTDPAVSDMPAEPEGSENGLFSRYVGGSAGYSVTYGHKEGVEYPQVTVIRSRQELEDYYDAYRDYYDMDSLEEGCTHWSESFFAEHDLLLVIVMENDGYACPQVGYLNEQEDGSWELTFPGTWEVGEGIDAETPWHIYVEIEKDLIAPEETICLVFE